MTQTLVRVVSMETAHERRRRFADEAAGLDVAWEFFPAHADVAAPLSYSDRAARRRFGRALTAGERGCYTSHYMLWQTLIASSCEQLLVLEDDVLVDWPLLRRLVQIDLSQSGIELIRLYSTHPFRSQTVIHRFAGPHSHLVQAKGMLLGTQGYLLTRRGAQRLVKLGASLDSPVDWLMTRYWDYGFANYCVFPFPILERYTSSSIGARAATEVVPATDRIVRFGWRVRDRLLRGLADHISLRSHGFGPSFDVGPPFIDRFGASVTLE